VSPVFAHGQLRLYLLVLLAEAPRHGYEVIQDLEARFGGLYTPSAGTVYPRLAKLEEEGLVARTDEGRKATYRITESGLAEVSARHREVADLQADLDQSVRRLADQVRATVAGRSADVRAELKAAAREARTTARPAGSAPGQGWPHGSSGPSGWSGSSGSHGSHGSRTARGDTPQDRPPSAGGFSSADWTDVERAASEVREQARQAWRQHGLTAEQMAEIVEILADTSRRIAEVLRSPRR
jgi:DNA-binding PadR family transcriptional regulator